MTMRYKIFSRFAHVTYAENVRYSISIECDSLFFDI